MAFELNQKQREAVEHKNGPLLIIAGAGTGKTAVITQRIIHLINSGSAKTSEILALTFTEKAAAEMVERVDMEMPLGYDQIEISTFHSFCDHILRQHGVYIGLDTQYTIMSQAQSYILFRKNLYDFPLNSLRPLGTPTSFIGDILKYFSRLQDEDVTPEQYRKFIKDLKKSDDLEEARVAELEELSGTYALYNEIKIKNSLLDFGDLINLVLKLFREKPHILEEYRERFKYILVDEFQDTNYTQNVLVNLLALGSDPKESSLKERKNANITVVGDDDQSIYKFRGAAISNIIQFKDIYPEAKKIVLTENYRSRQKILDSAYSVIQHNNPYRLEVSEEIDKRLIAKRESEDNIENPVQLIVRESGNDEADNVAKEILKLTGNKERLKNDSSIVDKQYSADGQGMFIDVDKSEGSKYSFADIALLARANSQLDQFLQAFKYYGIPFKFSGPKGLYSRSEVQILIAFLKVIADIDDDLSMFALLKMEVFDLEPREIVDLMQYARHLKVSIFQTLEQLWGVRLGTEKYDPEVLKSSNHVKAIFSESSIASISNLLLLLDRAFSQVKDGATVGEILYSFFKESGYLESLLREDTYESQFQIQNISKYFDLLKEYEEGNEGARVSDYVDYLNYSIEIGESPKTDDQLMEDFDAVNIMTAHSSKGLEFPVVFLTNLVSERFPTKNRGDRLPIPDQLIKELLPENIDSTTEHLSEERRLFYVGVTRAKERLYLTAAKFYGDAKRAKKISLFVEELWGEKLDLQKDKDIKLAYSSPSFSVQISSYNDSLDISGLGLNDIEKISYSHVNAYETCPKQYKYKYILALPTPPNATLAFGRSIHSTLYDTYQLIAQGQKPNIDEILETYARRWVKEGYDSKKHEDLRYKYGSSVIESFYKSTISQEKNIKPLLLEKWFKYKLDDIIISGSIDRIDQVGTDKNGNAIVELIDYKTGKVKDEKDVREDLQLAIYALVAEDLLGFKVSKASLLFVEHGVKSDVEISEELKNAAKEKIREVVKKIRMGEFGATPGFLCRYCDYNRICEDATI